MRVKGISDQSMKRIAQGMDMSDDEDYTIVEEYVQEIWNKLVEAGAEIVKDVSDVYLDEVLLNLDDMVEGLSDAIRDKGLGRDMDPLGGGGKPSLGEESRYDSDNKIEQILQKQYK